MELIEGLIECLVDAMVIQSADGNKTNKGCLLTFFLLLVLIIGGAYLYNEHYGF
jgi:hypothetical protein